MVHGADQIRGDLPNFDAPPVEETAFSIQFAPLVKFGAPHFGLYWNEIRDQFPLFEIQHPINPEIEQFEQFAFRRPHIGLQLVSEPDIRCWFLDESKNRLVQLQRDRFVYNWRRVSGLEAYPRYPLLRGVVQNQWLRLLQFFEKENLGRPEINQCEVTYVNHIELGNGWSNYGELSNILSCWTRNKPDGFLPDAERVIVEMHYRLPNKLGRLRVSAAPAIRGRDSKEILQLNLVARGAPRSSELEDIMNWMDLGREWIVKGFADVTTDAMHKIWRRTR